MSMHLKQFAPLITKSFHTMSVLYAVIAAHPHHPLDVCLAIGIRTWFRRRRHAPRFRLPGHHCSLDNTYDHMIDWLMHRQHIWLHRQHMRGRARPRVTCTAIEIQTYLSSVAWTFAIWTFFTFLCEHRILIGLWDFQATALDRSNQIVWVVFRSDWTSRADCVLIGCPGQCCTFWLAFANTVTAIAVTWRVCVYVWGMVCMDVSQVFGSKANRCDVTQVIANPVLTVLDDTPKVYFESCLR